MKAPIQNEPTSQSQVNHASLPKESREGHQSPELRNAPQGRVMAQLRSINNGSQTNINTNIEQGQSFQSKMTAQLKSVSNQSFQSRMTAQLRGISNQSFQSHMAAQLQGKEEEKPIQGKFEGMESSSEVGAAESPPNNTGMPDNLKSGIESLSGMAMDDVKVHYNSPKPAQLQAHAYAQGTDIHLAPGQSQHLPHEAWHVVQQKQGRVEATTQMKGIGVNDDIGLEKEADVMGETVAQQRVSPEFPLKTGVSTLGVLSPVQRKVSVENIKKGEPLATEDITDWGLKEKKGQLLGQWILDEATYGFANKEKLMEALGHGAMETNQQPIFGADAGQDYEKARLIFTNALKAGYRTFDAAFTYQSLKALWDAVEAFVKIEETVSKEDIHVIYKVGRSSDQLKSLEQKYKEAKQKASEVNDGLGRHIKSLGEQVIELKSKNKDDEEEDPQVKIIAARQKLAQEMYDNLQGNKPINMMKIFRDNTLMGFYRDLKGENQAKEALTDEEEKTNVNKQIEKGVEDMGGGKFPDILILHDVDDLEAAQKNLHTLSVHIKEGRAKELGISNTEIFQLQLLYRLSTQLGTPIKYVENRITPYHEDKAVREFCQSHNIKYIGYGLFGSAMKASCELQGGGDPKKYLLARYDPRLQRLAKRVKVSAGELLIAWSQSRLRISPIQYSSNEQRQGKNIKASKGETPAIDERVLKKLDLIFKEVSEKDLKSVASSKGSDELADFLLQCQDPTVWYIVNTMTLNPRLSNVLIALVRKIREKYDGDLDTKKDKYARLGGNLQRYMFAIQSYMQDVQNYCSNHAKGQKRKEFDLTYVGDEINKEKEWEKTWNVHYHKYAPLGEFESWEEGMKITFGNNVPYKFTDDYVKDMYKWLITTSPVAPSSFTTALAKSGEIGRDEEGRQDKLDEKNIPIEAKGIAEEKARIYGWGQQKTEEYAKSDEALQEAKSRLKGRREPSPFSFYT